MKAWKYRLDNDYCYKNQAFKGIEFNSNWLVIDDGEILIKAGYAWDGCSPKRTFTGLFTFGTPDGVLRHGKAWTYHASLVHDILCQYRGQHCMTQTQVTWIFQDMLTEVKWPLTSLYVWAVKNFGPKGF